MNAEQEKNTERYLSTGDLMDTYTWAPLPPGFAAMVPSQTQRKNKKGLCGR